MTLTALVDYDSGNLHSAQKAFERMAAEVGAGEIVVTSDADVVARADRIVLPGDGAFPACRAALLAVDGLADALTQAVEQRGVPFLGICVGMQMLAKQGHEYETTPGLGWIDGEITKVAPADPTFKVPHMGWNDLVVTGSHPVLEGIETGEHAYFVHSWAMQMGDLSQRLAHVDYAGDITAIVARDNIIGTQFHPEKSQQAGLRLIGNFLRWSP